MGASVTKKYMRRDRSKPNADEYYFGREALKSTSPVFERRKGKRHKIMERSQAKRLYSPFGITNIASVCASKGKTHQVGETMETLLVY
jgi:hypothetical protein